MVKKVKSRAKSAAWRHKKRLKRVENVKKGYRSKTIQKWLKRSVRTRRRRVEWCNKQIKRRQKTLDKSKIKLARHLKDRKTRMAALEK